MGEPANDHQAVKFKFLFLPSIMYYHGKSVCSHLLFSCAIIGIFGLSSYRLDQELDHGEWGMEVYAIS